jgi:type I restriction enzyme S subunit
MEDLKPYPKYKTIDLPWLKSIPEHWSLLRNKNVLNEEKEIVGENSDSYKLLSLTKQGVIYRNIESGKGKFPKEFNSYKIVNKNNLIFCLFDIDETPRTVGVSKYEGMITGAYDVFTVMDAIPNYIYYYYLSIDDVKGLKPLYTGLRKVIRQPVFLRTNIPLPPLSEQIQMANYLDYKVALINKFIKDKKKEIILLKEQIEYLCYFESNDTPKIQSWETAFHKGWKKIKAKRIFDEKNIKNCPNEELLAVTQDRGVVFKKDCSQNYVSPTGSLDGLKLVQDGDFVISLRSFQGGIEFSFCQGIVSPAYNVFALKPQYESEELKTYFRFLFKTKPFIELLKSLGGGIRDGKNISFSEFAQFEMAIPSDEQLKKILGLSKVLDALQSNSDKLFSAMNEYKTSLISDVITGKVDVRNIAVENTDDEPEEDVEEMEDTEQIENSEE